MQSLRSMEIRLHKACCFRCFRCPPASAAPQRGHSCARSAENLDLPPPFQNKKSSARRFRVLASDTFSWPGLFESQSPLVPPPSLAQRLTADSRQLKCFSNERLWTCASSMRQPCVAHQPAHAHWPCGSHCQSRSTLKASTLAAHADGMGLLIAPCPLEPRHYHGCPMVLAGSGAGCRPAGCATRPFFFVGSVRRPPSLSPSMIRGC